MKFEAKVPEIKKPEVVKSIVEIDNTSSVEKCKLLSEPKIE